MSRRVSLLALRCMAVFAVLSAAGQVLAGQAPGATQRPNILFIISDDIGVDAATDMSPGLIDGLLKQYGPSGRNHPQYQQIKGQPASTPSLNALARAGMRFTQAWVQPFCSNTRASILSGLYPVSTGVLDYTGHLSQNHHSFVNDLKTKGGYSTAVFGKWHVAGLVPANAAPDAPRYPGMKPKEAGFDLFQGNLNGAPSTYHDYEYHVQDASTPAGQWRTEKAPTRSLPGIAATTYAPVAQVADAANWITEQERRNPARPWFAWLAFNVAHISENQRPSPMVVPDRDTLDGPSRREMESCGGKFGTREVGSCTDKQLMRAMTNSMDTVIGVLLKTVDALDPNTYVIYIGDNGTWMFGQGREFIDNLWITRQGRGKGTTFESGTKVDLVVRGPRIRAGSVSDAVVTGSDLFPTILRLAGLDVPATVPDREGRATQPLDGMSLTPALFDGMKQVRDEIAGYVLTETINPLQGNARHAGVRNGRYKLVCVGKAEPDNCLFFDLRDDPLEEYPLAEPASCSGYATRWRTSASHWHFCRLQEVLAQKSFLARQ